MLNEKWSKKYKKSIDCNNPKGFSQKAHCAGRKARQSGKSTKSKSISETKMDKMEHLNEKLNLFMEKNVPTQPSKWAYWKSKAKEKFDVYPSAYANGWAAKMYKKAGGGWRSVKEIIVSDTSIHEGIRYHMSQEIPLSENVYRMGSDEYFRLFREAREIYKNGFNLCLSESDKWFLESDLGEFAEFEGQLVPLDCPMREQESVDEAEYRGKSVKLNSPKRGGSKKFYVYVRDPKSKNIRKVAFGAKAGGGNLAVKLRDPKARKAFSDRHNCPSKTDKTTAGYWSCALPRYAKQLGLSGSGRYW